MNLLELSNQRSRAGFASRLSSRTLQWLLKLLLSLLLLGLVFRAIEPAVFWKTLRSVDMKLLFMAIVLYFPGQLLAAYRWYYLLNHLGRALPFWSVVRHNTLGQLS